MRRALAYVLLAALVSLAGSGWRALTSSLERRDDVASDGREAPTQVARVETGTVRPVTRLRSSRDDGAGRQLAAALTSRLREGTAVYEGFVFEAVPRGNPRPFTSTLRTSRGPPRG